MSASKARLDDNVAFQVYRLNVAMRRAFEQRVAELGITVAQWAVMVALQEGGCDTATEARKLLGLDRAAVSRAVHELLAAGLISRRVDRVDRRVAHLALTARGRRILQKNSATAKKFSRTLLAAAPAAQRKRVAGDFARLSEQAAKAWGP